MVAEFDKIETADGAGGLVLAADIGLDQLLFDIDGFQGKVQLGDILPLQRVDGIKTADGKGAGGAEAAAGRQVAVMMDFNAVLNIEMLQAGTDNRVLDLVNRTDVFDLRPDDAVFMFEERRQITDGSSGRTG